MHLLIQPTGYVKYYTLERLSRKKFFSKIIYLAECSDRSIETTDRPIERTNERYDNLYDVRPNERTDLRTFVQ
jgi:hypothetical protein